MNRAVIIALAGLLALSACHRKHTPPATDPRPSTHSQNSAQPVLAAFARVARIHELS